VKGLDGVTGKRVSDEDLVAAYLETGSVHKAGARVGLHGASAHERLVRLGVAKPINEFTAAERERLQREYLVFRGAGRLGDLAKEMGRTVPFLCRQARELGLTDQRAAKVWKGTWKHMTESAARLLLTRFQRQRKSASVFCRNAKLDLGSFCRVMRRFFPDEWELAVETNLPKQSMYRFGRAFEYRVRDALREQGYFCLRSPQSKSPLDLIAIRRGCVLFVQCKRNGALRPKEWNELLDLAQSVGAVPLMAEISTRRGEILYWRLLARKDGTKATQPRGAYLPENA
jgi:Holliday junction resolvase